LAAQQADDSYKIAKDVTSWNRPTQKDQYGNTLSWTQDEEGKWTQDINLGGASKNTINNDYRNKLLAQNGLSQQLLQTNQPKFDANKFKTKKEWQPVYNEASGKAVSDATYRSVMDRARPQQERDMGALTSQLRQQGLQPGTTAYDTAMRNLMTSQGDVNAQAANQATISGYDEARQRYLAQLQGADQSFDQSLQSNAQNFGQSLAGYNQPYQNAAALAALAGNPINPSFSGFSGATGYNPADMLGAANAGYQAQMGGANASNAKKGSTLGSGLGFAGSMMGGK
jgi:hypothetical protein